MSIELPKDVRQEAIAFLEEIGPAVYNKAVADVQERLMGRVQELDYEVHEDEFPYWRRRRTPGKAL